MSSHTEILAKCLSLSEAKDLTDLWRQQGKTIVFTNGCFDLLHKGHIDYLGKARDLGDVLLVGLNSDRSVTKLKGSNRPLQDESSRLALMASLQFVDLVVVFDEDTPIELIEATNPDILVKGGDYTVETVVGAELVKSKGGRVEIIPFLDGYSTSAIEAKIIQDSESQG